MRLVSEILADNAIRLSSPDMPGMVRLARGPDQLWRAFREFIAAHRGVASGTWKDENAGGTVDALLADAEQATSAATRTQARKVRESFTRLQQKLEENAAVEREAAEKQKKITDAETALREAEKLVAERRNALRNLKGKKKGTPLASPGRDGRKAAAANRTYSSPEELAQRRANVKELVDLGVTAPVEIARRLDLTVKTVGNDLRALQGSR